MISRQILQNTLDGIKNITLKDICVVDRNGKELASTTDGLLRHSLEVFSFFEQAAESWLVNGLQYFKVFVSGAPEMAVLIHGEDEETYRVGKMTAFHIQNLINAYKEHFDRDSFLKNLLLDNLLLVDIYSRAKKLKIESGTRRVVYIIDADADAYGKQTGEEIVRNLFPGKDKDFVTTLDKNSVVLIKEIKVQDTPEDIYNTALALYDALCAEPVPGVRIAVGAPVEDLKLVSGSYKEARAALETGKIFMPEKAVVSYEKLGVGRLIYHLPKSLCKMFVDEVLGGQSLDQLDDKTTSTIDEFFRSGLSIAETARKLIIHRNTLVYRLDKLQKIIGLDLRKFDDAVVFYISLMVTKFMSF